MAKATGAVSDVPNSRFDRAWENILLYDEHTWGSQYSIGDPSSDPVQRQWAIKAGFAHDGAAASRRLLADGMKRLAARIDVPSGSVIVFNPSGRVRTGVVEIDLDRGDVIQHKGRTLPQQVTSHDVVQSQTVMFLAENVPAGGYSTYDVVRGASSEAAAPSIRCQGNQLENDYYKVTLDPKTGGIASLIYKEHERELVDVDSPYLLGQMVYVVGGHAGGRSPDPEKVELRTFQNGRIELGVVGGVFGSMKVVGWIERFPEIETEVVLYENLDRVDFIYRFRKKLTYDKEALYIAFPFAGAKPRFRYEIGAAAAFGRMRTISPVPAAIGMPSNDG
jgi:hypothetical protein